MAKIFGEPYSELLEGSSQKDTIYGDGGDDYIFGYAGNDSLNGGDDNDSIVGGKGTDTLTGGDGEDVFFYANGDGNDVITDYTEEDKIQFTSGTPSFAKKGNDVIITVGKGKITVKGAADKVITYIDSAGEENYYPKVVEIKGTTATLLEAYNKDSFNIADYDEDNKVKTIDASAVTHDVSITANKNANKITGSEEDDYIDGGAGKDTILGGDGNDSIKGGKGNDNLTGGDGADVFIYANGDGNDVITDYSDEDVIKITSGTAKVSTVKGSDDVILTVGKGKITVKGGKNHVITYTDADGEHTFPENVLNVNKKGTAVTLTANYSSNLFDVTTNQQVADYAGTLKTINASAVDQDIQIIGNTSANYIIGGKEDDTIIGGKGADTLVGGAGADVFVYNSGDGKDVITDYEEKDIIKIASGELANVSLKGSDVIFTFNKSNTITVKNAKGKVVTYIDADGVEQTFPETVKLNAKGTAATLLAEYTGNEFKAADYGEAIQTINASAVTHEISITGNGLANRIIGSEEDDYIDGGAGKDTILGGDGNDVINGGTGNDNLTGGDGADTFVYKNGGGKDVITDYNYDQGDVIQIDGTVSSVKDSGTNVVFTVGKGTITVNKAAGKYEQAVVYQDLNGEQTVHSDKINDAIVIEGKVARALETYNGSTINLNDDKFTSTVTMVDASAVQNDVEIIGTSKANSLLGGTQNDTLNGGKGNDTLTGGDGSDVFIYANGDGNDVITDYDEEDIIKFTSGTATAKTSGNNVIFTLGKGKVTVLGGKNHVITYEDSEGTKLYPANPLKLNADGTAATLLKNYRGTLFDATTNAYVADYADILKTIDGSAVTHDIAIVANGNANKITGSTHNDTLTGGKGNDTLIGGDGQDVFVYNSGDGKDVITDYTEGEDVIQIASGAIKSITNKNNDVIFTVGTGTITVKNAKNKVIDYIDADGVEQSYPQTFTVNGTTVKLTEKYNSNSFDVNDHDGLSKIVQIDASEVTGDISITGNKNNNVIIGAAGDNTINGAKGNDTLWGGTGSNTYLYANGDGNDLIVEYGSSDIVSITSGRVDDDTVNGDTVILKVGKGRISLDGAAGGNVIWYDDDGRHSKPFFATGGMFDSEDDVLLDDSNAQLSSIVQNSSIDYSLGKVDYGKETSIAQPDYAVAYSDKK